MSKVAVVYWSSTGNTESMANAVAEGAKAAGAEVTTFETSDFSADKVDEFDAIAFGCPAMGDEVLEEDEFEPMFSSCEAKLSGKKLGLFGSYGWGGQSIGQVAESLTGMGCSLICDPVKQLYIPSDEDLHNLEEKVYEAVKE